ncbi:MAG: hypothetical protein QOI03_933 [Solirubrobacteraceae bacterium]|jgi:hypothetical protein|nr:hypothetical protein [Solirubrobacteraceae bacterium]
MAHISRPFQIALVAVGLFAAVFVIALRPHSSTPPGSSSASASRAAQAPKPGSPSHVYQGPAPGVQGLSKAIAKAHGAVATSQQSAKQLEEKAAAASSTGSTAGANAAPATPSATTRSIPAKATATTPKATAPKSARAPHATATLAGQHSVEAQLEQGKVVLILFWNPKGTDDAAVRSELRLLELAHRFAAVLARNPTFRHLRSGFAAELRKPIAVHEAPASAVSSFGSITTGVQVSGTPTILVVAKSGHVQTITGLTDAYSIEQTIDEARHA